jgi:hypothetical protein
MTKELTFWNSATWTLPVMAFLIGLLTVMSLYKGARLGMDTQQPPAFYQNGGIGIGTVRGPISLTFSCGKGQVAISMETGKVTLTDCELDDAAKAFWKAVELIAPMKTK